MFGHSDKSCFVGFDFFGLCLGILVAFKVGLVMFGFQLVSFGRDLILLVWVVDDRVWVR